MTKEEAQAQAQQQQFQILLLKKELEDIHKRLPVFARSLGAIAAAQKELESPRDCSSPLSISIALNGIVVALHSLLACQIGQFELSIEQMTARKAEIEAFLEASDSLVKVPRRV